jgi:hypothetical protein
MLESDVIIIMRIPKIYPNDLKENNVLKETIKVNLTPINFYAPDFQDNEKDYVKLIKKIERMVRTSYEYKNYIKYLKEEIDMNQCSFFNKLTRDMISIEIHHAPLTLFEIVSIVFGKHLKQSGADGIDIFSIADEVTRIHYEGLVGLIPLSLTVHQLVHRGDIFIPVDKVYGNFQMFYDTYKKYFSEDQEKLLKSHIQATKQLDNENYSPSILNRKITYVNIDGITLPSYVDSNESINKIS